MEKNTSTPQLATDAGSRDPAVGLRAVASLRLLLEDLQELQVRNARAHGWSWQEIACALGVSKQAVHKRYSEGRKLLRKRG
ncbi:MAG: RNA polymerase subunit sigma-70 [Actinomycetota bacterium]|nr:RNA polymerase subunit sigma-70 [Actinomycetota bacterium]